MVNEHNKKNDTSYEKLVDNFCYSIFTDSSIYKYFLILILVILVIFIGFLIKSLTVTYNLTVIFVICMSLFLCFYILFSKTVDKKARENAINTIKYVYENIKKVFSIIMVGMGELLNKINIDKPIKDNIYRFLKSILLFLFGRFFIGIFLDNIKNINSSSDTWKIVGMVLSIALLVGCGFGSFYYLFALLNHTKSGYKNIGIIILFSIVSSFLFPEITTLINGDTPYSSLYIFILVIIAIIILVVIIKKFFEIFIESTDEKNATKYVFEMFVDSQYKDMYGSMQTFKRADKAKRVLGICSIIIFMVIIYNYYYYSLNTIKYGKLLLNTGVGLETETKVCDYYDIYGFIKNKDTNEYEKYYNFSISFWFYIDSTNNSIDKYMNILNCDYTPCISYNPNKNTLKMTVANLNKYNECSANLPEPVTQDEMNECKLITSTVMYENNNIKLQRWNNMVIVYNDGIVDIFYNKDLVKSTTQKIPYINQQYINVGEKMGIHGGICKIRYFTKNISKETIDNVYDYDNMHKTQQQYV